MALGGKKREKFLDGKVLFLRYAALGRAGSYKIMQKFAMSEGMVNPTTGRVSVMGVYQSMWKWAMEHQEESRPILAKAKASLGEHLTDDEWLDTMNQKALVYYSSGRGYERFLQRYPEVANYVARTQS